MPRERVLITVKTYPTLSETYGELVCTAGVREDGSWVRLYPVPFRRLDEPDRYRKFDWIETTLVRNTADRRPESFRLVDPDDIAVGPHLDTGQNWAARRRLLLECGEVHTNLTALIDDAHANLRSLATFRPTRVLDVKVEAGEREWPAERIDAMRARSGQGDLFSVEKWREAFRVVEPLPWKFSYSFEDANGRKSTLQILDWEAGALYWNCLRDSNGDEQAAIRKVRDKYLGFAASSDLHFFLGTTLAFHNMKAPNPWVIIGAAPFPRQPQMALL